MAVHSALSLPLAVGDQVIGAINSYSYANARDAFGEHAVQLGSQFAGPAAVSVFNAQLLARAQEADCAVAACVGQSGGDRSGDRHHAQPVLRQRRRGFRRLVHMSRTEYVKLRMVAERLVEEARRANARHREP